MRFHNAGAAVVLAVLVTLMPATTIGAPLGCPPARASDEAAATWLLDHGKTLRYPIDDYYAYRSGSPERLQQGTMARANPVFPSDASESWCPPYARFCFSGATWSPDHRFIATAVGDPRGELSPEVLVVRVEDGVVWRASRPEELFNVAWYNAHHFAFDGWPTWTSSADISFMRCVLSGRFDIVIDLASQRRATLPVWLSTGGQPEEGSVSSAFAKALSRFWADHRWDRGTGLGRAVIVAATDAIYVSDGTVSGTVSRTGTIASWSYRRAPRRMFDSYRRHGLSGFTAPYSLALGAHGVLFAADHYDFNDGAIYIVGKEGARQLTSASGWNPAALAADPRTGSFFVADPLANVIYHVERGVQPRPFAGRCERLFDGRIDTQFPELCGGGAVDGNGSSARFNQPNGLAYDSADRILFVADTANNEIRAIRPDGTVTTIAGACVKMDDNPNCVGMLADGRGRDARFFYPSGIAYDPASRAVFVADTFNHAIRRVSLDGSVATIAGNGIAGDANGVGESARFSYPIALAIDASGTLLVIDRGSDALRRVSRGGVVTTLAKPLF